MNGIESFPAALKRGCHGTFRHLNEQHPRRYITEFSGRHDPQKLETIEVMDAIARCMAGERLTRLKLPNEA